MHAWTSEMIVGRTLEDADAQGQSSYTFTSDGFVAVTSVSSDGLAVAPIFEWRIVNGRLRLGGSGFSEELTLVSASPTHVLAKWKSGRAVEFQILSRE